MEKGFQKQLNSASFDFDCEEKGQLCNLVCDWYQVPSRMLLNGLKSLSLPPPSLQ